MDFAIKALDVYQSDFYDKLKYINDPNYSDSILINMADEQKIISLLESAKILKMDNSYRSRIDKIILKVQALTNKSISELKNEI